MALVVSFLVQPSLMNLLPLMDDGRSDDVPPTLLGACWPSGAALALTCEGKWSPSRLRLRSDS